MHKGFLKLAALMGALTVGLGAFGAHTLKTILNEEALAIYETAVKYQFYHVFALIVVAILYKRYHNKQMLWAGRLFILGIIVFSGSLYLLAWAKGMGRSEFNVLGAITPIGGTSFILGWVFIFLSVNKRPATIA